MTYGATFFTTKPPGIGTGLELPMSREIVQRHRGIFEVREHEKWSVFVIELLAGPRTQTIAEAAV